MYLFEISCPSNKPPSKKLGEKITPPRGLNREITVFHQAATGLLSLKHGSNLLRAGDIRLLETTCITSPMKLLTVLQNANNLSKICQITGNKQCERILIMGCWWYVFHLGRMHVRRVFPVWFYPNTAGFLRVLRFPPVQTLGQWGMALTGPLGRTV